MSEVTMGGRGLGKLACREQEIEVEVRIEVRLESCLGRTVVPRPMLLEMTRATRYQLTRLQYGLETKPLAP
jgi:hypothetical protein